MKLGFIGGGADLDFSAICRLLAEKTRSKNASK
jgi:hypothetical protein